MAMSISEAQAELISSLAPDDIPIKLRCAICSKLAVNAYRLPCCEQAICETCQANLPPSCPVCEHSPLSAEDCSPNKSLRTTIRVFLRTAEKKREASRAKEEKASEPPTPVEAPKPSLPVIEAPASEAPAEDHPGSDAPISETATVTKEDDAEPAQPADPEFTTQEVSETQHDESTEPPADLVEGGAEDQQIAESDDQAVVTQEQNGEQAEGDGNTENFDGETMNGNFSNMGFSASGDFNQMQMMMAMQNGMTPNAFGGFPMMGMGMDPMTMQNMYMNGGFQGMGMNGMGGFGGGFGQGSNNNWNGSQSWNFDQNNYNQNGPGMGTGDFGNFNSGFQTGYNQGNYGQFNDYRRGNFGRGRGRGRGYYGGYGRGGYQYGGNMNYQDQGQMSSYGPGNQGQAITEANGGESTEGGNVDEYGRALRPENGDHEEDHTKSAEAGVENDPDAGDKEPSAIASHETLGNEANGDAVPNGDSMTQQTSANFQQQNGPGVIRSVLAAPDVPINAPTGPKAMRQGLPNTSLLNLRARGYNVGEVSSTRPNVPARDSPAERGRSRTRSSSPAREKDRDRDSQRERSKDRSRDYDRRDKNHDDDERRPSQSESRSGSRSRTHSRSRSRGHRSSRRRRRHRSESVGDEDYDDDHRRKKHKSRRHHYDDEDYSRSKDKEDKYAERSRSASPAESKRSSHRSRRDRDRDRDYEKRREREKDKDKDKDKDKYRDEDRKKSSHRSHRDRDYDRDRRRDKGREREKDRKDRKDRHRDRDKDRDRDHRHSSSRKHSTDAGDTPTDKDFKPPTGPRGFDIKGSSTSDRRNSQASLSSKTGSAAKDPHTLEREARDRERLLKEAQRIAGMGLKRGRGDDGETGSRKGRKTSRRSEAVSGGDEEERMRRLEAEREGGRWG